LKSKKKENDDNDLNNEKRGFVGFVKKASGVKKMILPCGENKKSQE